MKPGFVSAYLWFFAPLSAAFLPSAPQYGSRLWQTDDGLPHNAVTALAQTADDYLWIGTPQGCVRFDGAHFKTFSPAPTEKSAAVTALWAGSKGTLWLGTSTHGLREFQHGKFFLHPLPGDNRVNTLLGSGDGSLWVGTPGGLIRYRQGQGTVITRPDAPSRGVSALCLDGENIWIGTEGGLQLWKNEKLTLVSLPEPGDQAVKALCRDRDGQLWIGTENILLRWKDGRSATFGTKEGLPGAVTALCEDRHGTLWVGTTDGLFRIEDARLVPQLDESEKPFESVFCLREDHEGNLWAGTAEGLVQLWPKPFHALTREEGLSHGHVVALTGDAQGNLWIATAGGGLNRLDAEGKLTAFDRKNSDLSDSLWSLQVRAAGGLWVGSEDARLFRFAHGLSVDYTPAIPRLDSPVQTMLEDQEGSLWVGTRTGLHCYQKDRSRHYTRADGLPGADIRALVQDHEGNLWAGTDGGLALWKQSRFVAFTTADGLSTNAVASLSADPAGNLWIGTENGGLNRLRQGKFTSYRSEDGLFSDNIAELVEDDFQHLWIRSVAGIFRVSKSELDDFDRGTRRTITSIVFGKDDGLPSPQCSSLTKPGAWKGPDGRLWFATSRGVAVMNPANLATVSAPPKIVIGEIIADGNSLEIAEGDSAPGLVVPPGRGEIQFRFAALSFQAPEKNRCKYRLEGVDPHWVDAGTRRVAYYNNLKPGRYTFQVQGCNRNGVWNTPGESVSLSLQPHAWQTWWFKTFLVSGSLLLVGATVRAATRRRMQSRLRLLEQQHAIEKERTRIARDVHDDLGARVTEIQILAEQSRQGQSAAEDVRMKAAIAESAREMAHSLDAIVWAVSPRNDTLERMVCYLYDYAVKYLAGSAVVCRVDVPDRFPAATVSAELRHNLFLVVKETLNNIVKHSGATEVTFRVQLEAAAMRVTIEDNGKGFVFQHASDFGNGLENMLRRMETVGGRFDLESAPGKGTCIRLLVPLKAAR